MTPAEGPTYGSAGLLQGAFDEKPQPLSLVRGFAVTVLVAELPALGHETEAPLALNEFLTDVKGTVRLTV
jgi:hypothetical protein